MSHYKQGYFARRIGGIPTVLKREGEWNYQQSQHGSMREAVEAAKRLNLHQELRRQDVGFR